MGARQPAHSTCVEGQAAPARRPPEGPPPYPSLLQVRINLLLYQPLCNLHRLGRAGDAAGAVVRAGKELLRGGGKERQTELRHALSQRAIPRQQAVARQDSSEQECRPQFNSSTLHKLARAMPRLPQPSTRAPPQCSPPSC